MKAFNAQSMLQNKIKTQEEINEKEKEYRKHIQLKQIDKNFK